VGSILLSEADRGGGDSARAAVEKRLVGFYESKGLQRETAREEAERFLLTLKEETQGADQLMKFMKSNQQLLRDSIKFKGDMTQVISSLKSLQGDYDLLDESALEPHEKEKQKRRIISSMAGKLGWGPGLQAFSELDTLVGLHNDQSISARVSSSRSEGVRDTLINDFNMKDGDLSRLADEMNMVRAHNGLSIKADPTIREVLEYKVSRGLQDMNAAYRYQLVEKVGKGGMDGLLGVIKRGMGSFLSSIGVEEEGNDVSRLQAAFDENTTIGKIRQSRAASILGEEWSSIKERGLRVGASADDTSPLLRLLGLMESTERETRGIFGVAGERLGGFTQLSSYGKMSRGIGRGDVDAPLSRPDADLIVKGDVLGSMLNLASAGKLSPEAMTNYATLIAQAAKDSGLTRDREDHSIADVLPRKSGRQNFLAETIEAVSQWEATTGAPLKVGRAHYASISEFLTKESASTTAGQRVGTIDSLLASFKEGGSRGKKDLHGYLESLLGEDSKHLAGGLYEAYEAQSRSVARQTAILDPIRLQAWETMANEKVLHAAEEKVHKAVASIQDKLEVGAGIGIALTASLLMTGGLSETAYKQALGGAVLAFGFARSSTTGTGGAFRVRMAQDMGQGKPEGQWLQEWMVREATFAAASTLLHPYATRAAGVIMEGFGRLLGSPLARPMDMDTHTARGAVQAVSGAILSAIMGGTAAWGAEAALTGVEDISQSLGAVGRVLQDTLDANMRRDNEMALFMDDGPDINSDDDPFMEAIAISYEISEGISPEDLDWANLPGEGDLSSNLEDNSVDMEWIYDVA
jgi:hypothetical protein